MHTLSLIIFLFIGCGAGFLSGLMGIGGGILVVPSLLLTFYMMDFPAEHAMQLAAGTSLAAMIFTSGSSAWAHYRKKGIVWTTLLYLSPGMIFGSLFGASIAHLIPSDHLSLFFAIFMSSMGFYFLIKKNRDVSSSIKYPTLVTTPLGVCIGTLSSLMGIGGGIITVPSLAALGLPMRNAISISAITSFLLACVGTMAFLFFGLNKVSLSDSLGYLYLPAFFIIGISSSLTAPIGAKYAHTLPHQKLRYLLGGLLVCIGLIMIWLNL